MSRNIYWTCVCDKLLLQCYRKTWNYPKSRPVHNYGVPIQCITYLWTKTVLSKISWNGLQKLFPFEQINNTTVFLWFFFNQSCNSKVERFTAKRLQVDLVGEVQGAGAQDHHFGRSRKGWLSQHVRKACWKKGYGKGWHTKMFGNIVWSDRVWHFFPKQWHLFCPLHVFTHRHATLSKHWWSLPKIAGW